MSADPARPERTLFRAEAWDHLRAAPERQAMPGFVLPGTAWAVRALVALLVVGLAGLWFVRVPAVVAGRAVVDPAAAAASAEVIVLVPAAEADRLRLGQSLTLTPGAGSPPVQLVVTAIEPAPLSPSDQRDRFGDGIALAESVRAVRAMPPAGAAGLPAPPTGLMGAVQIDLGSDRLVERLPLGDLVARAGGGFGG